LITLSQDENLATDVKKFLPNPILELLTKKVVALTGDVCSLFEVLRGAIDLAVAQIKKPSEDDDPLNIPPTTVIPQHVLAALKAYTPASEIVALKGKCGSYGKNLINPLVATQNFGCKMSNIVDKPL
jgi:hypothetical protein